MNKQLATLALQFLQRIQMSGAEVQAYLAVAAALNEIVRGPDAATSPVADEAGPVVVPTPMPGRRGVRRPK